MNNKLRDQLLKSLESVNRPVTYCTYGLAPTVLPGLEVKDVGAIALPLLQSQAIQLKGRARQAPYGKGTETIVDTDVRRVWEVDAKETTFANPRWSDTLDDVVATVQSDLGLQDHKLKAHFYKLLLYEEGSFFLPHRDGEKLDRMVATLVIVLPSAHEGGQLIVRHEGEQEVFDFADSSQFQTQFAAFYADCEHEIRPVTKGYRLALIYNLTLEKSKKKITAPSRSEHVAKVSKVLQSWRKKPRAASTPDDTTKLVVLLDHQYTQAGLTCLKGIDRMRAEVLFTAAQEASYDASLALVTLWEHGSAEPKGGYGYYDDEGDDQAGHIMGELLDWSLTAENFSDLHGDSRPYDFLPLSEDEIVSKQPITERDPDQEDFEGFTGNAGMTLERWYHRAAIVIWPTEMRFDVLCEVGVEGAVAGLHQIVEQTRQADDSNRETLKQQCFEFANRIIANWPPQEYARGFSYDYLPPNASSKEKADDNEPTFLAILKELGDVELIRDWLHKVFKNDFAVAPERTIGDLCDEHGWKIFENEFIEIFKATNNETLRRHVLLLADWSLRQDDNADRMAICSQLTPMVFSALQTWAAHVPDRRDWRATTNHAGSLLPPVTQSLLALNSEDLLEQLLSLMVNHPDKFDLKNDQIPALLEIAIWLKKNITTFSPFLHRWLTIIVEEMERRTSNAPQKPTDWRRNSETGCNCSDCQMLAAFLADPTKQTGRFPLSKERRKHLHRIIDSKQLDTTHETQRSGRPFTLVCEKTSDSFVRDQSAHKVDLDQLGRVTAVRNWHAELPRSVSTS